MKKIKYLILCLFGFSLGLTSCNNEDTGFKEEPNSDPNGTLAFYSLEYDFSKKEIKEVQSQEFRESLENNSDQIIPMTFYPYLDQGQVEFKTEEKENFLDGLECEVPVPRYENDTWSESQTISMPTIFGKTTSFNPLNGNISFTINADPWETTKYGFIITFSELTVPFEAIFFGCNYGCEYTFTGILKIRVPINCDIKIEETVS